MPDLDTDYVIVLDAIASAYPKHWPVSEHRATLPEIRAIQFYRGTPSFRLKTEFEGEALKTVALRNADDLTLPPVPGRIFKLTRRPPSDPTFAVIGAAAPSSRRADTANLKADRPPRRRANQ